MNKQIDLLVEKTSELIPGVYCLKYESGKNGVEFTEDALEKFAELIVRECIAYGKLTQSQMVINGSEEYNAGREMGIEVFMNQIKLHFGIEDVDTQLRNRSTYFGNDL